MRQLVSGGLLPADAPVSGRGSVAPAGESLQLRLHAGGERRAGLPRHQPAAGVQQPGQAERGGPRAAGGVQRGPGPGGRAASGEPCHQEEPGCHADALHLPQTGPQRARRGTPHR